MWKSDKKCDKTLFIDVLSYCLVGDFFLFVITFYVIGIILNCFGVSRLNNVQNKLAVLKNKSSDYFHFYGQRGSAAQGSTFFSSCSLAIFT